MPARNSYLEPSSVRRILLICSVMRTFKNNESCPAEIYSQAGDELGVKRESLAKIMQRASEFGFMVKVSGKLGTKIVYRCVSYSDADRIAEQLTDSYYNHMQDKSMMASSVRPKSKVVNKAEKPSIREALSIMGKLNGVNHAS